MITSDSLDSLRARAECQHVDIESLDARGAMDLVLDWYSAVRSEDAYPLEDDGDGVLIQWGTLDFETPQTFQFDVARQLICADDEEPEEDAIWQLHLTLHYEADDATSEVAGDLWVFDPAESTSAREVVARQRVLELLDGRPVIDVVLELDRAD
ncbi:UNVERIFIED_CONTAM: hypothetical protein OHV15_15715 [Microbacterium sp. SLM126]